MNVPDLIRELEDAGVHLWEDAGELRFRAPRGALTDVRRTALREWKPSVVAFLRSRAGRRQVEARPADAAAPFPLTDVQSAYLLGRRASFAYGGVGCHGYAEMAFPSLDPSAVTRAWRALIRRHPMLRAVIGDDGTQRVQLEVPDYEVAVDDVRGLSLEAQQAAIVRTRAEMDHRVYRPDQWPLFDVRMTQTSGGGVLHFSIDLLIGDFLSTHILLSELQALLDRADAVLPDVDITFRDYVVALAGRRDDEQVRRARQYWLDRLDELPPPPDLPIEPRPTERPRFRRWQHELSPERWSALSAAAAGRRITPSTVVLAVFVETLARWCSRRQFSVNITLQQRARIHEHVDRMVGDFTTLNLLAVDLDDGHTFLERARALQARLWEDLDHQRFSGTEVMRELSRRRHELAMFPIVFTSSIGVDTGTRRGLGDLLYGITQTPQVWIDCQASDSERGLFLNWDVRDGVFPDGVIDEMFSAAAALLTRTATDASVWDEASPIALPPEQAERRRLANATEAPVADVLLHERVVARALQDPARLAVVGADGSLTYGELLGRARGLADALARQGTQPGELIAIVLEKGHLECVAVLGVLLAGGVYVPVDAHQPAARRNRLLEDAGVRVAVAHSTMTATADWPAAVTRVLVDRISATSLPDRVPPRLVGGDGPAYVIYTSGSTGAPKGVVISHRSAVNTIEDITRRFGIGSSDRVLGVSSLGFDLSVYDIFGLLAAGGCLVLPDPERRADPSHWARLIADHGVTVWNSVPALLQMLQLYLSTDATARRAASSLRLALLSGDWIPVRLPDHVRAQLPDLQMVSLGGATEASIWSIFQTIDEVPPEWTSIPYGRPLANQRWHVVDRALRPCPDLVPGELYIAGAGLALGYWRDDARTAERFIVHPTTGERWYRTGDWGRYLRDGAIEFLGRDDRQVKIRGHRIELAEIETAISARAGVAQCAVLVDGDRHTERRLCAFASLHPSNAPLAAEDIKQFVATRLPDYMVPSHVQIVDELPITANGKVDHARLRTWMADAANAASAEIERPVTELEQRLAAFWGDGLGVAQLGRRQGFLTLGGDSLRAARLAGRVRQEVAEAGHALFDELLQQLLANSTLEEFAAFIAGSRDAGANGAGEDGNRLVTLRTLVSGGERVALVIAAEGGDRLPAFDWRSLCPHSTVLAADLVNIDALLRVAPESMVATIAEACVNALLDDGRLRVDVIGIGASGSIAVEVARQMAESGAIVDRLFVDGSTASAADSVSDHLHRGLAAWDVAPYAGDLAVILWPGDPPLAAERRAFWEHVCLGEVTVVPAGGRP